MSDSASDPSTEAAAPFVENDQRRTELPYDKGGLPFYVAIAWVGIIVAYVVVMSVLALPDLRAWIGR